MKAITEFTLIPLSMLSIIAGGVFWLSSLYSKVQAHSEQLSALENKQEKQSEILQVIREDVAAIKYQVTKRNN